MDKTHVERGTEYEQFVQAIYQALLSADGVDDVKAQHNIILIGNSGCEHQIDIYWEFRLAGQLYRTAIECKAFNKNVPVGRVRDFYGVLTDVPGLMGVFVTLVGYQRGAKLFAKHYGISLKELRRPTENDWDGRVKDIHLRFHIAMAAITDFAPQASSAFLASLPDGEEIRFEGGFQSDETIIFDDQGNPVASWEDIRQMLPTDTPGEELKTFIPFPNHVCRVSGYDIGIDGIDLTFRVEVAEESTVIHGEDFVEAIIKDVGSGELTVVSKEGDVRRPRN